MAFFGRLRTGAERLSLAAGAPLAAIATAAATSATEEQRDLAPVAISALPPAAAKLPVTSSGAPLHLVQANVFLRHGARTPVHVWAGIDASEGWRDGAKLPASTPEAHILHATKGGPATVYDGRPSDEGLYFGVHGLPAGQLTTQGGEQLAAVGRGLRDLVVEQGGALEPELQAALASGGLYLRSTNMRRTIDSLRSAVGGMYPGPAPPLPVHTVSWDEEHLAPSARPCPRLASTFKAGRARFRLEPSAGGTAEYAAVLSRHEWESAAAGAALAALDLSKLAGTTYTLDSLRQAVSERTGVAVSEVNFVRLRDALIAAAADGQAPPAGWDAELVTAIDAAGTRQLVSFMEGGSGHPREVGMSLRLGIGRLVQEVALRTDQAAFAHALHVAAHGSEGQQWSVPSWATAETYDALSSALAAQAFFPPATAGLALVPGAAEGATPLTVPRLCIYSAHDSTLLPLLMALGAWDGGWPPFASSVSLELYSTVAGPRAGAPVLLSVGVEAVERAAQQLAISLINGGMAPENAVASADGALAALAASLGGGSASIDPATAAALGELIDAYVAAAAELSDAVVDEVLSASVPALTAKRDASLDAIRDLVRAYTATAEEEAAVLPAETEALAIIDPSVIEVVLDAVAAEASRVDNLFAAGREAAAASDAVLTAQLDALAMALAHVQEEARAGAQAAANGSQVEARAAAEAAGAATESAGSALARALIAMGQASKAGADAQASAAIVDDALAAAEAAAAAALASSADARSAAASSSMATALVTAAVDVAFAAEAAADGAIAAAKAAEAAASKAVEAAASGAHVMTASVARLEAERVATAEELVAVKVQAELMAQLAATRAAATRAIAGAADIASAAAAEAARAVAAADVAKARAGAEAEAAKRAGAETSARAARDNETAVAIAAATRARSAALLANAAAEVDAGVKALRAEAEAARFSFSASLAALRTETAAAVRGAEAEGLRAMEIKAAAVAAAAEARAAAAAETAQLEALAAEQSVLIRATIAAQTDAASALVQEVRARADAEARAAQAETRAIVAEAAVETYTIAKEALMVHAIAEEVVESARGMVREAEAEAARAEEATVAAKAAAQAEIDATTSALEVERARLATQLRIARTAANVARHRNAGVEPTAASAASAGEDAAAWLAKQLQAGKEGAAVPAPAPAPVAPVLAPASVDPYTSTLTLRMTEEAAHREEEALAAALPAVLRAMGLRDTKSNRARALRYIVTVGQERAVAGGRAAPLSPSHPHAGEGSENAIVPLSPRGGEEDEYVAAAGAATRKGGPPVEAAPAPAPVPVPAPAPAAAPEDYLSVWAVRAAEQGLPVPLVAQAGKGQAAAPVPALAPTAVLPSLQDSAYLAAFVALSAHAVHAEVAGAEASAPAPAPAQEVVHGEGCYLVGVTSLPPQARVPAPAPHTEAAREMPPPAAAVPVEAAYGERIAGMGKAVTRARAGGGRKAPAHPTPVAAPLAGSSDVAYLGALTHGAPARAHAADPALEAAPEYFIRVVYNGRALRLPGSLAGPDALVPLPAFRALLAAMIPTDYERECGLPAGAANNTLAWPGEHVLMPGLLPELTATLAERTGLGTIAAARAIVPSELAALEARGEDVAFDTLASDPADVALAAARAAKSGSSAPRATR